MSKLMIVESPNKIAKISSILGDGWTVKASVGHIRDLPEKGLGINSNYRLEYVPTERGADVIKRLKFDARNATEIYLATDPDREGEAIAWHVADELKVLQTAKRITFSEITAHAIQKAIASPRQIDMRLVRAQEARRGLDRLVGYKVSPVLSAIAGERLSAGRVQSPGVRLIVEREREIRNFKAIEHFSAEVQFDSGSWRAKLDTKPLLKEDQEYLLDRTIAEMAASCREFRVVDSKHEPEFRAPPAPLVTSTLLQAASAALRLNPDKAMAAAQGLFEGGHITYHRTDSPNLSEEAITAVRTLATENNWPLPDKPRKFRTKAGAQEAHEAIRPTHWEVREAGETKAEKDLYRLIWLRAVACQLADAEFIKTALKLETEANGQTFTFKASGSVPVAPGWKVLTQKAEEDDEDEEESEGSVPNLPTGTAKQAEAGRVVPATTKPPKRYKLASLVKKLEALGIGRPSTYASITTLILLRKYAAEQKDGTLVALPAGEKVIDHLAGKFLFLEYYFTRDIEDSLDLIASARTDPVDTIKRFDKRLDEELLVLSETPCLRPCPKCGGGLIRFEGKHGPFWACRDTDCGTVCPEVDGLPGEPIVRDGKPSDKQLEFARKISADTGTAIPEAALSNSSILTKWIDTNKGKMKPSPASPAQMKWVQEIVSKGAAPPPGYPDNVTAKTASAFMDKHFSKGKKGKK